MPIDSGVLTTLLNTFETVFTGGYSRLYPDAMHLLSILAILEVAVAALWWVLCEENVMVEFLKKIIKIGFFIFLVANYHTLINAVLDGFVFVGLKAGGGNGTMTSGGAVLIKDPSAIVRYGLELTKPIFAHTADYGVITAVFNIADILITPLAGFCIILAYFALAIQVFITYLEFFLVAVLGLMLIPFGAFKHTAFMAEKVFGAIVSFGVRLMVLAFILATADPVLFHATPQPDPDLPQVLLLLLTSLTIAGLSWHAPAVAAGLISGSPSLTAGTVAATGLAAGGAVVGAGAAVNAGISATSAAAGAVNRAGESFFGKGESPSSGGSGPGGTSAGSSLGPQGISSSAGSSSNFPGPAADTASAKSGSAPQKGSPVVPDWAYKLALARQAIPQDAHPSAGMSVPLRHD